MHLYLSLRSLQLATLIQILLTAIYIYQVGAAAVKHTAVKPELQVPVLLMPQADYFSTVITLSSPLCRSGLWGLMDTAMYNSFIISIQFDN